MRKSLRILYVFILLVSGVSAQSLEDQLQKIDDYANVVANTWQGPGMAIAIVKNDKVVFAKGYGKLDINKPDKIDENTVFVIASNSKAFLAASLAILVDEGKIKWEDKVRKYLPDFELYDQWVSNEMTIRDLLVHRNGLDTFSGDLLWYETTYSAEDILKRLKHLKPVSSFRTQFGYQNVMFVAGGEVVKKVSGKPWTTFVKERILDPLNMDRTTTTTRTLPENSAFPHNESGGKLRVLHRGNVDGAAAAAGLNSSVTDISKWIRLQLGRGTFEGKKILSSSLIWEMWQPYMYMPISERAAKANPTRQFSGVGMGWFTYNYHGKKIINHSGGLDGMLSYTVLIPEDDLGFVVLTNSEFPVYSVMMNKITDIFTGAPEVDRNKIAKESYDKQKADIAAMVAKVNSSRIAGTKPSLSTEKYAAKYVDDYYGSITVADEAGKLVLKLDASPNLVADLEHWHFDTFRIHWRHSVGYNFYSPGFVTFKLDKNAAVESMTIDQPNNDFWFYEMSPKRAK